MAVLYRNYRPKTFAEVIGQEHIKATLQRAVANSSFAHAYLFTGIRGTGKTSVARILARAINCPNQKNGEPCNTCDLCKTFLDGNALDLVEIDAASNTGVENIREIIEHLKFSPSAAKYKVFIVDEVHMLSKGAFNALLKTLEEPPKHAVFILATTEIHKVPATIISRTQRFDFRKIESEKLLDHLRAVAKNEKLKIDDQSLELVLNSAEGSVRDALSILDKLSTFENVDLAQTEQLLGLTNILAAKKFLDLLIAKNAAAALDFLQELFAAGADPVQFNKDFLEYLRKLLIVSMGGTAHFALDDNQVKGLKEQGSKISTTQLLFIIRLFLRANKDFQISPNSELPLEIAAAEACASNQGPVVTTAKAQPVVSAKKAIEEVAPAVPKKNEPVQIEQDVKVEHNGKVVNYEELLQAWPELMQKLRDVASTLLTVMKSGRVKSVENNMVTIAFTYKFHKESMDNNKNKHAFLNVLNQHFGTNFGLKTILEKPEDKDNIDTSSVAMEVFGG